MFGAAQLVQGSQPDQHAASYRRSKSPQPRIQWLVGAVLLVVALIAGLAGLAVHQSQLQHRDRATIATQNLSRVLEQYIIAVLDKTDVSLKTIALESQRRMVPERVDGEALNVLLAQQHALLPELESLRATDAAGEVRFGPGAPASQRVNLADRDFYIRLRDDANAQLVISGPVFARISKKWVIVLARRLNHPDGTFAGVVYANIAVEHFQRLFSQMGLGTHGAVSLRTSGLNLATRYPDPSGTTSAIGSNTVSKQLRDAIQASPEAGVYVAPTALDQIERANAYRKVGSYPFYIIVGLATDDYLAAGRTEAIRIWSLAALAMAMTLLGAGIIYRLWRRQDATLDALGRESSRNRLLLRTASDGIHILDDKGHVLEASDAFCAMLGYERSDVLKMNVAQWDARWNAAELQDMVSQIIANKGMAIFETQHRRRDGTLLEVEISATAVVIDGKAAVFASGRDITERKRSEARERLRNQIFELLASGGELSALLTLVVEFVENTAPDLRCSIQLVDEHGQPVLRAGSPDLPACHANAGHGKSGTCWASISLGKRIIVEDLRADADWVTCREQAARAGLAACWSEPIKDARDKILGCLTLYRHQPGRPSAGEIELMQQATTLASIAVVRRRLEEERLLASSVYQFCTEAILVTDADNRIAAINPAFTHLTGYSAEEAIGRDPKFLSAGQTSREYYQAMWRSLSESGRWQGEIRNRRKDGELYVEWLTIDTIRDEHGRVTRRIGMFSDITERKLSEERVWRQANYDALTGLPNRRLFRDRLELETRKLTRSNAFLALFFIDLDYFKEINDTRGHDIGDLLLVEAAHRISNCVRGSDTVARLGGDEFTVLLTVSPDSSRIDQVAQAILQALREPFQLAGEMAFVSASIGITLYPDDADDIQALFRNADQAMYVAKAEGRNCFRYFTQSLQAAAQTRLQLSNDLRGALTAGQFEIHYQPIVELATGRIVKAEALLRWRHPVQGWISPSQFIPIAEEIGVINEIGDWVFREAATAVRRWRESGWKDLKVSINKSPRQFFSGQSRREWPDFLQELNLAPDSLVVEITEGLLLDDRPEVAETLLAFRDAGIEVAIDDFGTGYSAMAYLKKFHVDYLKIDQSFIRGMAGNPSDHAIVEAIVVMAHKLGIQVIAEGIETSEQRDALIVIGCDFGQGYLLDRPMPLEAFTARLTKQNSVS